MLKNTSGEFTDDFIDIPIIDVNNFGQYTLLSYSSILVVQRHLLFYCNS